MQTRLRGKPNAVIRAACLAEKLLQRVAMLVQLSRISCLSRNCHERAGARPESGCGGIERDVTLLLGRSRFNSPSGTEGEGEGK